MDYSLHGGGKCNYSGNFLSFRVLVLGSQKKWVLVIPLLSFSNFLNCFFFVARNSV
jgi:hypothetical protein